MDGQTLVIIPAHNEAERIGSVLSKLCQLPEYKVLVLDDGSTDETCRIVQQFGFQVVSSSKHLGYGGVLKLGYKYALDAGYKYVVQVDADGQHEPFDIPQLLLPLNSRKG